MARALAVVAVAAAVAALGAGAVFAERSQVGNLIVSLDGDISPARLPRHREVPIGVHFSGSLRTADGSTLPRVTALELQLAGHGGVFTRGLPACAARLLRDRRSPRALAVCGPALVGHGRLDAHVLIPGQAPFPVHARLLVFYGGTRGGRTTLLVHGYAARPPTVVVVPFVLRRRSGRFNYVLDARMPRTLGPWPRVASFELTISRRFSYRGVEHGFLNGSCPVPPHFTEVFFNLARVTFTLADGDRVGAEIVRGCHSR